MPVAVTEQVMDQAIRILSGEGLAAEKQLATEQHIPEQFSYFPLDLEGETIYVALETDASPELIAAAKAHVSKGKWTTVYINSLPDSAFAYIEPGGEKDADGKTTPRSKRHLPYKDKDGNIDAAHVRNALARLDTTDIPDAAKKSARSTLESAAKKVGVEVASEKSDQSGNADSNGVTSVYADPDAGRFEITTEEHLKTSMVEFAEAMMAGEYPEPARSEVLKRMGERKKLLVEGQPAVTKDIGDAFAEALDAATDNALLGALDGVYYAMVRCFAGSWPDTDPDQLSRDDFNMLVDLVGAAFKATYDKLADDEGGAAAEAQARAVAFTKHGLLGALADEVESRAGGLAQKAGKRHSKHDEARMEIIHGAVVGLGYTGCAPVSGDDESKETGDDADADDAAKAQKQGSVTGSDATGQSEAAQNVDDEMLSTVKTLETELATVKAQVATSESELSRVKEEPEQRIATLEEELQAAQKALGAKQRTPKPDPLAGRPAEKVTSNEDPAQGPAAGARHAFKQLTREMN